MAPELQRRFDAMEQQREFLRNRAFSLSDAQLVWKPSASDWSVQQITEHLVLSEETVGRPQEGVVKSEAPMFRILPRRLRRALILGALRRGTVLPLPSPNIEPKGDVPLPELLIRWQAARSELNRFLSTLQGSETRYSHPVLGPLTVTQMLELAQTHTAYHTRQMEALLGRAEFSKN
ncbi:MAG: DinB family protein [Armatimonadota bacterium]